MTSQETAEPCETASATITQRPRPEHNAGRLTNIRRSRAATPPRTVNAPAKQGRTPTRGSPKTPRAKQTRAASRVLEPIIGSPAQFYNRATQARRHQTNPQPKVSLPKSLNTYPPSRGAILARNESCPRKTGEVQGREQTSNSAQRDSGAGQPPTTAAPNTPTNQTNSLPQTPASSRPRGAGTSAPTSSSAARYTREYSHPG